MQVPLKGVVKIFEAGLQYKTWDIHGMPHFITMTHFEGCNTCEAYTLHVVEAVRCIYAPDKVNPTIFQFYFTFSSIFHHTSMHPLLHDFYEFYLIFYYFISPFIIY